MKRDRVLSGSGGRLALVVALAVAAAAGQPEKTETPLAPGLVYQKILRPGPVVVHVLRAELAEPTLSLGVELAGRRILETEPLSAIAQRPSETGQVAGALNGGRGLTGGDPYQGAPIGLVVSAGELLCDPWPTQRSALILGANRRPRIELLGLRGKITGADGQLQRLGGLNRRRLPGEMVLYDSRFNATTKVLEPGLQVVLSGAFPSGGGPRLGESYRGVVQAVVDGLVNLEIPPGGAVLAGSGPAAAWLGQRTLGETVTFSFELAPDVGPITAALGAGPRLVRDGEVSIEAEAEKLGIVRQAGRQPRSAAGFNERYLFLVGVDGRSPGYSIGLDLEDLARLMLELGCTQAMELEGGGATTVWARDKIVNQPSDGLERPLSNALVLRTTAPLAGGEVPPGTLSGGGQVPVLPGTERPLPEPGGPPVVPVTPAGTAVRLKVLPDPITAAPGEKIGLTVAGEDAAGQPIAIGLEQLQFQVDPPTLGTVDATGTFLAETLGQGSLTVRFGGLRVATSLRVSRGSRPLPPIVAPGTEAPLLRPDLAEPETPTPVTPGAGTTTPTPQPPRTDRIGPDLPAGERRLIDGFEQQRHWTGKSYPADVPSSFTIVNKNIRLQGSHCGELRYDFSTTVKPRWAYALYQKIIGFPKAVSVYVFGDSGGHTLKGQFIDRSNGQLYTIEFAQTVDWDHQWRRVSAVMPETVKGPVIWECFFLVQTGPEKQNAGAIYLDQFEGIY